MQDFIKKRGISQEIYDNFGLKFKNNNLNIPVFDLKGEFLFYKIRHNEGPNKYTYSKKGSTAQLYCGHLIKNKNKIVITEGELDALVLWSQGIPAVSTTSGAISAYKDEWVELLKDKDLYICYDNDEAGRKGAAKLKKQLPNATVLFINGVKDISEYYEKHGEVKSLFKLTKGTLPEIETQQPTPTPQKTNYSDDRVEKAKDIPITQYQKFNKDKKINCIFHNEDTPSLAYNPKTNTYKCFGCGEFGDSIAFYMKLFNVDFMEALNQMVGPKKTPTIKTNITKLNKELKEMGIPQIDENKNTKEIEFLTTGSKNPHVRCIGENIKKIFDIDSDFKNNLRYNIFTGLYEMRLSSNEWKPFEDNYLRIILNKLQVIYPFFDKGVEKIFKDTCVNVALDNPVSPPLDYIKKIEWDKKPRLNEWLHKTFKVENNPYYKEIGTRWLKYLVKRLAQPGCKFDHVLVVQGWQGFGKSTIFEEMCRFEKEHYYVETTDAPDSGKDLVMNLAGNIIVEFAEGAITGYNNQKRVKSFITRRVDKYRPPYMRSAQAFPRQCVFAMSTNDAEFLNDKTGERRYWILDIPENIKFGDIEWIKENRDQLFAEAYTLIDEPWVNFTEEVQEIADTLVSKYKTTDPLEDFVIDWYDNITIKSKEKGIILNMIREDLCLKYPELKDKYVVHNIAIVLKDIIKLDKKRIQIKHKQNIRYFPTENTIMNDGTITLPDEELEF